MLHEIRTDQLRIGMFVKAMDCSWLASPFWRRQFTIGSPTDIDMLRTSGITLVTIDDLKGAGPAAAIDGEAADRETADDGEPAALSDAGKARQRKRVAVATEVDRARATVERSRRAVVAMFNEARMGHAVHAEAIGPIVDDIAASVACDANAMLKVTRLKSKTEYTYLHSVAVCALMINLARRLDLPEADTRRIGMAGLLHDIGKVAIPLSILDKPGDLDEAEWRKVQSHPAEGHRLLSCGIGIDELALDVCLHHHERIDGRGYPFGRKAEEISVYARMGAICDVYDAVTSNRPYKQSWSPNEALARMLEWKGHFDPDMLAAFIDSIGIPPIHSLVRLQSNRLALVVDGSHDDPTAPRVRAFYSIPDQALVALEDVETTGDDRIIRMERGDYWFSSSWADVRDSVAGGILPRPDDILPPGPFAGAGSPRNSPIRVVIDAIDRDRQEKAR